MEKSNTIKLLKSCNSGCKMATNSIKQVIPYVHNNDMKAMLNKYNDKHVNLGEKSHEELIKNNSDEEDPIPVADLFAKISTDIKLLVDNSDEQIAKIMMKGCNMGIETISRHINEYSDADKISLKIAHDLVEIEEDFLHELELYV